MISQPSVIQRTSLGKFLFAAMLSALITGGAEAEPLSGAAAQPYLSILGGLARPLRGTDTTAAKIQPDGQLIIGLPIDAAVSLEAGGFYSKGNGGPRSYAAGLDLALRDPDGRPGLLLLAGFGGVKRSDRDAVLPYVSIGTGLVLPVTSVLRLRTEARLFAIRETTLTTGRDLLLEARFGVGLELAYPAPPARQAPAVESASRPPAPDSDGDGIADASDRCPGSAPLERINADGCAVSEPAKVAAAEEPASPAAPQVFATARLCPEINIASLSFDATGCLIPQAAPVPEIQFERGATKLTTEGAASVDRLATALRSQPNLKVKIVGYASGADAQSTSFYEHRADLVKSRLIGRGVAENRLRVEVIEAAQTASEARRAPGSIGLLIETTQ